MNSIACNFADASETIIVTKVQRESSSHFLMLMSLLIHSSVTGSDNDPYIFKATFVKPVGHLLLITSDRGSSRPSKLFLRETCCGNSNVAIKPLPKSIGSQSQFL
jgi:hypothetical protein